MDITKVFAGLPAPLVIELLDTFREISSNFTEHRWEPSELNGGKFCEVVYSIVNGTLAGSYPAKSKKPQNMLLSCQALEQIPSVSGRVGDRSLRILIPRFLPVIYEIRNNRGVGHVGGDVDPNLLDATAVYQMSSWVLAELVRIFHGVSTSEAQEIVDSLVERKIPLIWKVEDTKRVLDPSITTKDQVLLLLHQSVGWVTEKDLFDWVEYSSLSMLKTRVLLPLHKERKIEFEAKNSRARISPIGISQVEDFLLKRD